jgi:hypothetical protein
MSVRFSRGRGPRGVYEARVPGTCSTGSRLLNYYLRLEGPRIVMNETEGQLAPMYRRLPRGPGGMGPEEVARNQRTRLYSAMIEAIPQRGYEATTVAHVIALAGVSPGAFYELFSTKEQCFLATERRSGGDSTLAVRRTPRMSSCG